VLSRAGMALHGKRLLIVGRDTSLKPARNISDRFRDWPKTSCNFSFWTARFLDIARGPLSLAAEDPFWPDRPIVLCGGWYSIHSLVIVPRQPGRRALLDLLRMPQQCSQVLEGIHAV